MALIIPPGFAQAVYVFALSGDSEPMVTTLGHDVTAAGGEYDVAVDRLHLAFDTDVMGLFNVEYSLTETVLYVGQDGGPPTVHISTLDPAPGRDGGSAVPQNTAHLVRKRTDLAGRRGRGRMYFPGVGEAHVSHNGTLDGTWLDDVQTALDAWWEDLTGVPVGSVAYPPVVLHRAEGAGVEPAPTPVTRFVIEGRVATQRRRLRP